MKKYLIFVLLVVVVVATIILIANSGSFRMIGAVALLTIVTTLVYCIFKKELNFWSIIGVTVIGGGIYLYAIGWLIIYTCPKVTFVKDNKEVVEKYFLPTSRALGNNRIQLMGGKSYIMNQTGATLYISKVAYGDKDPIQQGLVDVLNANNVISTVSFGEDYYIRWFMGPRDKIRVPKDVKGKYVIFIDYQPYN